MSGTKQGAAKSSASIRRLYGEDYFKRIGRTGGQNGSAGGFRARPDLARVAGKLGGHAEKLACREARCRHYYHKVGYVSKRSIG